MGTYTLISKDVIEKELYEKILEEFLDRVSPLTAENFTAGKHLRVTLFNAKGTDFNKLRKHLEEIGIEFQ